MITPFGELPDRLATGMSLAEQHEWLHRKISRRAVLGAGLAVGAGLTVWSPAARAAGATQAYGMRVAYGADPRSSMVVSFAVEGSFRTARVRVSRGMHAVADVQAQVTGVPGASARYCAATFTGLETDTSHGYVVELDGVQAGSGTFRTAMTGATPFRFTAYGDQGIGPNATRMVGRVGALDPRLHLFLGDLSYADATGMGGPGDAFTSANWDRWLRVVSPVAGSTPWMYAFGNHEMEPGFDLHGYAGVLGRLPLGGVVPPDVPAVTTFTVGNVGFIALDSNDVSHEIPANRGWSAGRQTAWLERTLARLRAPGSDVDFVVAFMHHPPYTTNTSHACEGGIRESWVPLFDRYQVDLVLSGHSHAYERVKPLRAGTVHDPGATFDSSTATTYITAGGGGAAEADNFYHSGIAMVLTESGPQREIAKYTLVPARTGQHAAVVVDVEPATDAAPATMRLSAVAADGSVVDRTTLVRGRSAAPPSRSNSDLLIGGGVALAAGGVAALAASPLSPLRRRPRPVS